MLAAASGNPSLVVVTRWLAGAFVAGLLAPAGVSCCLAGAFGPGWPAALGVPCCLAGAFVPRWPAVAAVAGWLASVAACFFAGILVARKGSRTAAVPCWLAFAAAAAAVAGRLACVGPGPGLHSIGLPWAGLQ